MAEEIKLTSKELLNQLTAKHYQGALEAKAEGKPVVWATSICPDELLAAMDLTTVYPENHAAAIGAHHDLGALDVVGEQVHESSDHLVGLLQGGTLRQLDTDGHLVLD